ncbi:MAG: hypothetical protein Q8O43_05785, partial [Dehalococcoidia bacterium]|nr:hypothetical protein [Dehalococcoidia bacterium]
MGVILERSEESQSGGIRQRLPTTRFFVVPMLSGLLQNDRPIVLRQAPRVAPTKTIINTRGHPSKSISSRTASSSKPQDL